MIYKSFDNASICPTRIVWLRVVKKRKVKRGSLIEEVWSSTRVFTRGSFLRKQKLFRAFLFRPFVVIADRGDCEFYCPFDSNRNSWAICSKIRLKCLIFRKLKRTLLVERIFMIKRTIEVRINLKNPMNIWARARSGFGKFLREFD